MGTYCMVLNLLYSMEVFSINATVCLWLSHFFTLLFIRKQDRSDALPFTWFKFNSDFSYIGMFYCHCPNMMNSKFQITPTHLKGRAC